MNYGPHTFNGKKYTLQECMQLRGSYFTTMGNILDKVKHEKRELTLAEEKDFDGLQRKFDAISTIIGDDRFGSLDFKKDIDKANTILDSSIPDEPWRPSGCDDIYSSRDLEPGEVIALAKGQRLAEFVQAKARYRGTDDELFKDQDSVSFGRIIRGMVTGDWKDARPELRIMAQAGLGGAGYWTVPDFISAQVIDLARNLSVCMRAGALTMPMDGPEVTVTKIASDPTAYWRPENKAITESVMTFEPLKLKATVLGILCRVSVEQMMDSANFGDVVESAIAAALALEMDRAMLLGSGSGEPRGVYNTTGVQTYSMGTNGAALTNYDPFSFAAEYVANENGVPNAIIYAPRTWGVLDRLKEATTNAPLKPPASYESLQKFTSNQVPINQIQGTATNASCSVVGDYVQLALASLLGIQLNTAQQGSTEFSKMQVLIRGFLRADVAVIRPKHFCKVTGIIPA